MYHLAQKHFKQTDALLYRASVLHSVSDVERSKNVFEDVVRAIVNQQLSGKAAETIFGRLETLLGKKKFNASNVLGFKHAELRACGLSKAKAQTIHGLAQAVVKKEIDLVTLHTLSDGEVVANLTSIKGIGPWTAEMILMFSLGRIDIFSPGDLGLRKGIMHLYGLKRLPSDAQMKKLTKKWSPYRTYASRVLWRIADAKKK